MRVNLALWFAPVAICSTGLVGWAEAGQVPAGSYAATKTILPAWPGVQQGPDRLRRFKNAQFRNEHPEMYGVTQAPLQPVTLVSEFARVEAVSYIWFPGMEDDFYWALTQAVSQYEPDVEIELFVEGLQQIEQLRSLIESRGGDPDLPEYVDLSGWPTYGDQVLDSIWTVDLGPFWVIDGAGRLAAVDPRYYFDRVNDDAVPYKLTQLLDLDDFRPDLSYEGGNLTSDGQGACIGSTVHLLVNLPRLPYEVEQILADYLGCSHMIWLEPLIREATGHVDMFAKLVDSGTVLVGRYEMSQDPDNAELLDRNAALLSAEGYDVVRIPMPDNDDRQIWRTYTNSLVINDLVLVPVYAGDRNHETEALDIYRSVYPGKTVVAIDSDGLISIGGAIHCVTRTRPQAVHAHLQDDIPFACNGAWDCVSGCGDIDHTGSCVAGVSAYCDNGSLVIDDCEVDGLRCGWDIEDDYINCLGQGCGTITLQGECKTKDGVAFAVWCADDYPLAMRCGPDQICTMDEELGHVVCVGPFPCMDECGPGEVGCSDDGRRSWSCGEAGDGDHCLDRVFSDCPTGLRCQGGLCRQVCIDECESGTSGCLPDGRGVWVCGEADDGDDCLDRVESPCSEGMVCKEGRCEPEGGGSSTSSGCGCRSGPYPGLPFWPVGLMVIGFVLRLRRRRHERPRRLALVANRR